MNSSERFTFFEINKPQVEERDEYNWCVNEEYFSQKHGEQIYNNAYFT